MSNENVFSLVMCRVAVSLDDEFIKKELIKTYPNILHVERIYDEENEDYPTDSVRIDFHWNDQLKQILENRQIVFNGTARRVYPLSKFREEYLIKKQIKSSRPSNSISERELRNYLQNDQQRLINVLNSFEVRLNKMISS